MIGAYEQRLTEAFLAAAAERDYLRVHGPGISNRTPTFAVAVDGLIGG